MRPTFKSGSWSFFHDRKLIAFNPEINDPRPEIPVYGIGLDQLTSSAKLLDAILQIQQKGRWSARGEEARNNYGRWHCDDYQVGDFIAVVHQLCRYYHDSSIQGVFSAWGNERVVDWVMDVSTERSK